MKFEKYLMRFLFLFCYFFLFCIHIRKNIAALILIVVRFWKSLCLAIRWWLHKFVHAESETVGTLEVGVWHKSYLVALFSLNVDFFEVFRGQMENCWVTVWSLCSISSYLYIISTLVFPTFLLVAVHRNFLTSVDLWWERYENRSAALNIFYLFWVATYISCIFILCNFLFSFMICFLKHWLNCVPSIRSSIILSY